MTQVTKNSSTLIRQLLPTGPTSDIDSVDRLLQKISLEKGSKPYIELFKNLFELDLDEETAKQHWSKLVEHHRELTRHSDFAVDIRASGLDYVCTVSQLLLDPKVIEKKQYLQMMQDTVTDALTGLYNFRQFHDVLEREIVRADRYHTHLSLILLDIDHFKSLNDQFGHPAGDHVLRSVSSVISESIRKSDIACRQGGEEFVVITPETNKALAVRVAERIRRSVEHTPMNSQEMKRKHVTVSIGVATFPGDGATLTELVSRADQLLYQAKQGGRNRVEYSKASQRRHPRFPVLLPAELSIASEYRDQILVQEASDGGFLIQSSGALPPGGIVDFHLGIEKPRSPVQCTGKIAYFRKGRQEGTYNAGVAIIHMSPQNRTRYRKFLSTFKTEIQPLTA